MARTYRNVVKFGICTGSNTEYYREKNRKCRAQNRHSLRNAIANYDVDKIDEVISSPMVPIHDDWDEPTDGTYIITKKDRDFYVNDPYFGRKSAGTGVNFWNRKIGKYLKNKH